MHVGHLNLKSPLLHRLCKSGTATRKQFCRPSKRPSEYRIQFTLSQWERRPKVVVLHGEQMCRSICPPWSGGVVMCVPVGIILCQVHSSITRWLKSYARTERSTIHATGFRGHTHTHTHTHTHPLCFYLYSARLAASLAVWFWSDTRVICTIQICFVFEGSRLVHTCRALQNEGRELQGHCAWALLY